MIADKGLRRQPHCSWRLTSLVAAALAALGGASLAAAPAFAQSGGYNSGSDGYDQNDGSYESDPSGGYSDTDDEDGYEDGQDAPDVAYFYDELEDQGSWVSHPEYGQVWTPRGVDRDWRPYTRGTWANTEEHGWYWVSDEPFGWATYHYGRWHLDDGYGWVWVPGTRWGPAWVAWRSSDEEIGWAPLPPDSYWDHGHGLRVNSAIYESPRFSLYWSFVQPRYVTTPRVYTYFAPRERHAVFFSRTRPQTNYVFVNRRIVNRGVSVTTIERVTRTRVTTVRVNASDNRTYRTIRRDSNSINVYRPKLTRVVVRDRPGRKAVIDRSTWRDVDRRPVRKVRRDDRRDDRPAVRRDDRRDDRRDVRRDDRRERDLPRTGSPTPVFPNNNVSVPDARATGFAPGTPADRAVRKRENDGPRGQFRSDADRKADARRARERDVDRARKADNRPQRSGSPNIQVYPKGGGERNVNANKPPQKKNKKNEKDN